MRKAAVLILNYNGRHHLEKFLSGIKKHSGSFPIIIGDNKSTDESVHFLKVNHPDIQLITLDDNYGYAGGYNRLINEVDSEYIVVMNSDIECNQDWLPTLIEYLDANDKCAAVQPKILSQAKPEYFEYAGASGGYIDGLGYPFCRGRVFDTVEKDEGQYDDENGIFWASGACFVVRRRAFMEAGGFDEDFFAHMEEIDLCWRFHKMGYSVNVVPESKVYHLGGGTLDYSSPFKTYLNFRNGLYLLVKNKPLDSLPKIIRQRKALDWLSTIYFIMKGRFSQAKSIFKAHSDFDKNQDKMIEKNRLFSEFYPTSGDEQISDFLLVKEYFLKGKKTFRKLIPDRTTTP